MKISEVIIKTSNKTWEGMIDYDLMVQTYEMYDKIAKKSKGFSILAPKIFDEYAITDLIVDYSNYKEMLLEIFKETDQIVEIVDRILSYLEYNELD